MHDPEYPRLARDPSPPGGQRRGPAGFAARSVLLLASLATAACTDHVTDPVPDARRNPSSPGGPMRTFVSPIDDAVLSSSFMDVPSTNLINYGAKPWTELAASFADAQWVELRTSGLTERTPRSFQSSQYCYGTDAWPVFGSGTSGGAGFRGGLRVSAAIRSSLPAEGDYSVMVDRGDGQVYRLARAWPGARLFAKREGIGGVCNGQPLYDLSGGQDVEIRKVTPVQVEPDKTEFLPGEVLSWTTQLYHGVTASSLRWTFERTNGELYYPQCWSSTCQYAPPGPGRMKVAGNWELALPAEPVHGYSPQVTIRQPKLQVTCAPARLPQGNETKCRASVDLPVPAFVVQSWSYSGTAAPAAPTGDVKEWTFKPGEVASGTVTVTALVGSAPQTETAQVEIVCNFFREPTGDSYLDDAAVQDLLHRLWRDTNADGPANSKKERGAYIMERAGVRSGIDYTGPADRCSIDPGTVRVNFAEVKGTVHTHPDVSGPVPTDGSCHGITTSGFKFADGPSTDHDEPSAKHLNQQLGREIPHFVVDRRHVHRYGPGIDAKTFNRNGSCVR